jgi:hypothetical protein
LKPIVASRLARLVLAASFASLVAFAPTAAWAICGDGEIEETEECDDANSIDDDCCSNECKAAEVESFCTDGNPCTFDFCDGSGFCSTFPNQQAECDDGNACTVGDFCNSDGFCTSDGTLEDGDTCFTEAYCGGRGQCSNGFCFGHPADCDGFGGACNAAECNPESAQCDVTQLEDGTVCDNPDPCTEPGVCKSGECDQPPTDCSDFADACNDAGCHIEAGGCFSIWKENGTPCDDTNGCTLPGTCDDGECSTEPKDCSSFADQCNDAACDPKTEEGCLAVPKDDGTKCDDDANCTLEDACTEGTCAGTPRDCSEFGDACNVPFCNPQNGECETTPVEVPTECDDGDPCTVGEECRGSFCGGGEPVDCSNFDTACTTGVCNIQTGECEAVPNQDGGECDDGDRCTLGDECVEGVCAGTPLDCSGSDDQCNVGFCNGDTGGCESEPIEKPIACDDNSPCTDDDTCDDGECVGTPRDCSEFDTACTTGGCGRLGECFAIPNENGGACDDGDKCTSGDECVEGECEGTPLDCSDLDSACRVGICNGDSGGCEAVPVEEPTECNDGDLCTGGDECDDGECVGTPRDCSDLDGECVEGACNPDTGSCVGRQLDDGEPCNDGQLCTTGDVCGDGTCAGEEKDCSASGGNCLVGDCNPDTGQCVGDPVDDGTPCNDGNGCTGDDECTDGQCAGDPIVCDPSPDPCKVSFCNANLGACDVSNADNGTTCSDGNECTTGDECEAGACTPGTPKDCSSLDAPCKDGVCNVQSGLCETVDLGDGSPCSDGAFCTATDSCTGGVCSGTGDPCPGTLVCDGQCDEARDTCNAVAGTACESDGNPCTDDVCNGEGDCGTEANENACDDGLFCTTDDRCADGTCIGVATCPQTNTCGDTCDEANDACRVCGKPFSNSRCIVNAIFVLQGALALRECELCTCDVDSNGQVTATDALMILRTCTDLPVELECPAVEPTTTTPSSTTTTLEGGCEAGLHNLVFNEKYTCTQTNEGGEPFCADQNEQDAIRFTHAGGGFYEVRDEPDTGFVYTGSLLDCTTFSWNASSPGEYSEGGVWQFSNDQTTFSGQSAYIADDLSYAGACNQTGARSPAIPPNPPPLDPCD